MCSNVRKEVKNPGRTVDETTMSAALHLEAHDPFAEARAKYRAELAGIVDELAQELEYQPGRFAAAARAGLVDETPETSELLVVARLFR
jgi:hypothetical protein